MTQAKGSFGWTGFCEEMRRARWWKERGDSGMGSEAVGRAGLRLSRLSSTLFN